MTTIFLKQPMYLTVYIGEQMNFTVNMMMISVTDNICFLLKR